MAMICNECELRGNRKPRKIWCKLVDQPCLFVRFCAVSSKYYQTDEAAKCKVREEHGRQNRNR